MKLIDCKQNKRYLFFYSEAANKKTKYFIGNFNLLFPNELIVSNWERDGMDQEGILSIPRAWINNAKTLNDIVDNTILPEDIVLKIGQY
jgi:hypothetical protein|tara:strand:- start:149 stop:415 length:267 start_codon:yes stop_codon:yes gene_type:complete